MNTTQRLVCAAFLAGAAGLAPAHAQVTVTDPWVRATVPQQKATGLFANVTSARGGKVVAASSPVAEVVEIHEMAMDNNVMRMRAIAALDLPPGKAVELKPGGFHVMLMGLKQQVKEGETVAVTLVVEGPDGKREHVEVKAAARAMSSQPGGGHRH
ncbi:MAG: copper chaperone PCu(A)C [Betaproteobacteria bacterium]|nr:copper chaperone PCu(A)C [Betaproteobacteria bacterium]NBX96353.1 copper chaperone PCu(A)C [Betaproteobacteria bacterium]